jgi:hypothetical protein
MQRHLASRFLQPFVLLPRIVHVFYPFFNYIEPHSYLTFLSNEGI